jgi:RNA polymerase sigma-70 factor (ECF subfamily)
VSSRQEGARRLVSNSFPLARFPALPISKEKEEAEPIYKDTTAVGQEEPSDEALVSRICSHDREGLALLFRRYARLVWTVGRRILRNNEEADDLLQDVFLFVSRKARAFDSSKGSIRSFLVHATYQKAISRRRYLTKRYFYASKDLEEDTAREIPAPRAPLYDESVEAHLGREALRNALADMSTVQRETLRLHFFEGYTLEEIASHLGESYGNTRHHFYRGLDKLRKQIPQRQEPVRSG